METYRIELPLGAVLTIEVHADVALAMVEQWEDRATHLRPLLETLARLMREAAGKRFAEGGNPHWPKLAPATVRSKLAAALPPLTRTGRIPRRLVQNQAFGPAGILIRTGAYRDSWRQKGAKGHVEVIDEQAGIVAIGSRLTTADGKRTLASLHQKGTHGYTIRARLARALAFPGSNGETLLRRAVQHPGVPPRPVTFTTEDVKAMQQAALAYFAEGKTHG